MSTFNGTRWIKNQIESILNQNSVEIDLIIRDDGSNDEIKAIVESFSKKKIKFSNGKNFGVPHAYWILIKSIQNFEEYNYFAFSDQDDIWLEEKLKIAENALEKVDLGTPTLWICRHSPFLADSVNSSLPQPSFSEPKKNLVLCENSYPGNTLVLNRALFQLIQANPPSKDIYHDSWALLMATFFGCVIIENQSLVLYRIHDQNVIGLGSLKSMRSRFQNYKISRKYFHDQALQFKEIMGTRLNDPDKKLVENFLSLGRKGNAISKWKLVHRNKFGKINKLDSLAWKLYSLFWKR